MPALSSNKGVRNFVPVDSDPVTIRPVGGERRSNSITLHRYFSSRNPGWMKRGRTSISLSSDYL